MIQAVPATKTSCRSDTRPVICHVIHALGVGGAELLVDVLVRRMKADYRCIVAVLDEIGSVGARLQADGIVVEHLHRQPGIDRSCAKRLRAFADREGAQLLHAHQYTPFFQAMLSRGLTGARPVLFTEHGRHFPDQPGRRRALVNRLLIRRQDRLVGVGGSVRRALIDNEGLPSRRVEVIYNGVDLESLAAPSRDARCRIRREFGIADNDLLAVQVARLHPLKDHLTAVRAVAEALPIVPNLRLLIVGDGPERGAIESMVAARGLQSHVILAGARSDIPDLLTGSDLFLMSSISEGIPLTIIEAMAAGLPVVSTAVGGIPEMIQPGKSGLLCPPADPSALARSLIHLLQQPALQASFREEGLRVARERFSLHSMLSGYRRLYQEMLHVR